MPIPATVSGITTVTAAAEWLAHVDHVVAGRLASDTDTRATARDAFDALAVALWRHTADGTPMSLARVSHAVDMLDRALVAAAVLDRGEDERTRSVLIALLLLLGAP